MRDFSTLAYIITSLISGLTGAWLSNKQTNHNNLDDENDRLSNSNKTLNARIDKKNKKIDELRSRLNKKEEDYIKLEATVTDQQQLIDSLRKELKDEQTKHKSD